MKTYAGIDLHSSNDYIGIINEKDEMIIEDLRRAERIRMPESPQFCPFFRETALASLWRYPSASPCVFGGLELSVSLANNGAYCGVMKP